MNKNNRFEIISLYLCGCIFFVYLSLGFISNLIYKAPEVSMAERRVLKTFPDLWVETGNGVVKWNETIMAEFEEYALDNFIGRDFFRRIKAYVVYDILRQKDNHGIFVVNKSAAKVIAINEKSIEQSAEKIKRMKELLPKKLNVYYAVIPDKGFYMDKVMGYPKVDYDMVERILLGKLPNIQSISLKEVLSEEDFYKTDLHWRQEKLTDVLTRLSDSMDVKPPSLEIKKEKEFKSFYGVYYSQSALPLAPDQLICLTTDDVQKVRVSYLNTITMKMEEGPMYDESLFKGADPYDVYLRGPQPLIVIDNPKAETEKELYLFRDSYSSSLAPLLAGSYKKITLIDLRYLASPYVKELVNFKEDSDVLFLYSIQILNDSSLLLVK